MAKAKPMVSNDISKPSKPRPSWRNEPWASREAKRQEWPLKGFGFGLDNDNHWQEERSHYLADPEGFKENVRAYVEEYAEQIHSQLHDGLIAKANQSADPKIKEMQQVIDTFTKNFGGFETVPELIIHSRESSEYNGIEGHQAGVTVPQFIEMADKKVDYFLQHPKQFKMLMAHELAHIHNGDNSLESNLSSLIDPIDRKREILADRKAAIIYGNPREYAKIKLQLDTNEVKAVPELAYMHTQRTPSPNATARMLHKWADILENAGAADPDTHKIVNKEKALDIFKRSKDFTIAASNIDSFSRS